ncbi:MAG: rhodanese-like domain-containing protein [Candidatus Schekmanbacteria bacterium]|nr:rhodanese-like domain-containing protein [Candidatus Schekmanbacteria bacterium]
MSDRRFALVLFLTLLFLEPRPPAAALEPAADPPAQLPVALLEELRRGAAGDWVAVVGELARDTAEGIIETCLRQTAEGVEPGMAYFLSAAGPEEGLRVPLPGAEKLGYFYRKLDFAALGLPAMGMDLIVAVPPERAESAVSFLQAAANRLRPGGRLILWRAAASAGDATLDALRQRFRLAHLEEVAASSEASGSAELLVGKASVPAVVTAQELDQALKNRPPSLLADVRPAAEYRAGHIPGARSVTLGSLSRLRWREAGGASAAIYGSGEATAKKAATVLLEQGLTRIYVLRGGMDAWMAAGLPTETGQRTEAKSK